MNNPETRASHKKIMGSREFIEKSAIKRNKTFQTNEYKERTSRAHIHSWKHVVDREKRSNSMKEAWKKDRERRVASLQGLWDDESRRKLQLEGMRIHFAMKKDPNVTPEEFASYEKAAKGKGFLMVSATPLTRSSYHAGDDFAKMQKARQAAQG